VKAHEQAAAAAVQGAVLHSRSHGAQFRHEAATLRAAIAEGRAAVISYDARAVKAQQELGFLQVRVLRIVYIVVLNKHYTHYVKCCVSLSSVALLVYADMPTVQTQLRCDDILLHVVSSVSKSDMPL
jgi:hypothetical protein